jgi:uncharacterized protein YhfF
MKAEELWRKSGLNEPYESWSFGGAPDELAALVKKGEKTATCSAYDHVYKEGEGDRSLEYWRKVHIDFLTHELSEINKTFTENTLVVCEEFELVYS